MPFDFAIVEHLHLVSASKLAPSLSVTSKYPRARSLLRQKTLVVLVPRCRCAGGLLFGERWGLPCLLVEFCQQAFCVSPGGPVHSVNRRLVSAFSAASTAGAAVALATSTSIKSTSPPRSVISIVNFAMSACRSLMSAHSFSTIWDLSVPPQLTITPTLCVWPQLRSLPSDAQSAL